MSMTLAAELHIDEPQLRVAETEGRAALRAVEEGFGREASLFRAGYSVPGGDA